jgi:outer membrane autotransporter protein
MDSVLLEFLTVPPPVPPPPVIVIDFESFAKTPNEKAAGNLLDTIQIDPKAADLMAYLYKQPFSSLPGDLAQISPDALTSFYEITFSNANIQRLNIEGRLDDLRAGSTGFSSNMNVKPPPASPEGKGAVEGKSGKNPVEQALQPAPENRWGIWVTGFGDFVNVDGDYNGHGYDFTTGGFTVGVDYRITDQFAIGAMGEYAHTWTSLKPSGDIDVDSGRGGVYATWFNHGFYLDGAIYGGHNVYSSSRATLGGMASGGTGGAEYNTFISGGYDFHCGHLTVGPTAALQYTYVNIDSFSEHGSLAPLDIHSQSAESLRSDFGLRAFYQWQIGKVLVEPSLRAAWEHEYKYSALPITAGFAGIPGPSATFFGPSEGHDSAIVSAGVSVQWTPMIATYINYDGQLGRSRYDSNAVTGGVKISF